MLGSAIATMALLPSAPQRLAPSRTASLRAPPPQARLRGFIARMGGGEWGGGSILHQPFVDERNPPLPPDADNELGTWYRRSGSEYAEESRQYRRTVYMHDEWVKHRSSERFIKNLRTSMRSGVMQALSMELLFMTMMSFFCVLANMLLVGYQDFHGVMHQGPLHGLGPFRALQSVALPALPFTIGMPALSLLLVFRVNTAYARWNEARTLWGGVVNNCRTLVRQANLYFPMNKEAEELKDVLAANTAAFAKALRNFLRGPTDDKVFRAELTELVKVGLMSKGHVDACMRAKNRPMFQINAINEAVRKADIHPIDRSRMDTAISTLTDLTGACERIFKSPVPLVYTRHTSRFLTVFLLCMPFGLWPAMSGTWNHWLTIPVTAVLSFFLLGIEEIGIQIEEPFSILPLEALCNGAIAATIQELLDSKRDHSFQVPPGDEQHEPEVVPATAAGILKGQTKLVPATN